MSTILTGLVTAAMLATTPAGGGPDGLTKIQMMGGQGYGPGYGMMGGPGFGGGPWWDEDWDRDVAERVEGRIAFLATEIGIKQEMEYKGNTYQAEFAGYDVTKL